MAGGMRRGRSGLTLAERSALSGAAADPAPAEQAPAERARGSEAARPVRRSPTPRHCWVTGLPSTPGRCPGLIAEWLSEDGSGWFGRVVYAVVDDGRVVLVEEWVPAEHLAPADG